MGLLRVLGSFLHVEGVAATCSVVTVDKDEDKEHEHEVPILDTKDLARYCGEGIIARCMAGYMCV